MNDERIDTRIYQYMFMSICIYVRFFRFCKECMYTCAYTEVVLPVQGDMEN